MATASGQGSRATASELAETAREDAREAARREELKEEERQRAQETLRRKEEERCATWEAQMGDSEASRAVFKAQEELSAMRAAHQAGIVSAGAVVAAVGRLRAAALAAMAQWSRAPIAGQAAAEAGPCPGMERHVVWIPAPRAAGGPEPGQVTTTGGQEGPGHAVLRSIADERGRDRAAAMPQGRGAEGVTQGLGEPHHVVWEPAHFPREVDADQMRLHCRLVREEMAQRRAADIARWGDLLPMSAQEEASYARTRHVTQEVVEQRTTWVEGPLRSEAGGPRTAESSRRSSRLSWLPEADAARLAAVSRQARVGVSPQSPEGPGRTEVEGPSGETGAQAAGGRQAGVALWPRDLRQDDAQMVQAYQAYLDSA